MRPSYLEAYANGRLAKVVENALKMLESCQLCPRGCKINRLDNKPGFCRIGRNSKVYSYLAHHGEEPPISGSAGSGTIFFSGCNMACVYCQNFEFSQSNSGREVEAKELAGFMLELQTLGCHNINLVTPAHILPQILEALIIAIENGLELPLVYNTSGYDSLETLKLLEGIVDIYLPDMRYADKKCSLKYSAAPDYPEVNRQAIKEMHRQVGTAHFDENEILTRGMIIRHLVLPENIAGTEEILKFISQEISPESYISLMSQYMPYHKATRFKELSRRINIQEYDAATSLMEKYGLYNGWTQEAGGLDQFAGPNIKPI
jgi:putative pyruvate formate lyase activating enzyme